MKCDRTRPSCLQCSQRKHLCEYIDIPASQIEFVLEPARTPSAVAKTPITPSETWKSVFESKIPLAGSAEGSVSLGGGVGGESRCSSSQTNVSTLTSYVPFTLPRESFRKRVLITAIIAKETTQIVIRQRLPASNRSSRLNRLSWRAFPILLSKKPCPGRDISRSVRAFSLDNTSSPTNLPCSYPSRGISAVLGATILRYIC